MIYVVEYFLGQEPMGAGQIAPVVVHGEVQPPRSIAYFCEYCGVVWARAIVMRADGSNIPYHIYSTRCSKHESRWPWDVPGSMWLDWNKDFCDSMPAAVRRREVLLHCAHADRLGLTEIREGWLE